MSTFQLELHEQGRATGLRTREVAEVGQRSGLSWPDLLHLTADTVLTGNLRAMRLAELELMRTDAIHPVVRSSVITGAAGLAETLRWTDAVRLESAVATILGDRSPSTQGSRLERLGRAEVVETGQAAFHDALQTSEGVEGWVRDMEPGACQLCEWWSREGRIWPKAHPMPKHKGCECTPRAVPVGPGVILETEYTKRLARAEAKAQGHESEWK